MTRPSPVELYSFVAGAGTRLDRKAPRCIDSPAGRTLYRIDELPDGATADLNGFYAERADFPIIAD